jgi:hypothetical protein
MIIGVIGGQGSGKSLFAALYTRYLMTLGVKAYANMELPGVVQLESLTEIPATQDGKTFWLDEAMLYLDSRAFGSADSQEFTQFLLFIRKLSINMIWTTNAPHQVDKRLRDLTGAFVLCRRVPDGFEYLTFDPLTGFTSRHFLRASEDVFRLADYDTYAAPGFVNLKDALATIGAKRKGGRKSGTA